MKPYVVVKFSGKVETVTVVPFSWISEDELSCKWPPKKFSTDKVKRLIIGLSKPTSEFNNYPVTVMYAYDKYHNARKAYKLAEDDSNLDTAAGETDLERPRKKRKTKRLYDSEESNDEPPQVMKKKSNRIINSDSDEDEKSNAQKLKDTIRTLIQQKRNSPVYQHRTSSLPLKHSSKNTIVELTKPSTSTDLSCSQVSNQHSTSSLRNEVDSAIDSSAIHSSVVIKDVASFTDSLSTNSPSVTDRDECSNTSALTQNTLFENDKKCEILLKVLIEQIEEMSGKLDHVNMSLTRVYAKLLPEDSAPIKPKDLPNLPLKNEEAFYAFDNFLKNDNFLATVDYFVLLMPTAKIEEAMPVGKLLAKIFSNLLARIVNYSGSGSVKIKLRDTNIFTAIQCAIVKKFPSCNITHV